MWQLTIYDSREDYNGGFGQRSYFPTKQAAYNYMRGYGECFDFEVVECK
ncbi:MAG: hypothetical protein IJ776_09330 [Paludibacteraceae bacterium]|nr:hypothetical protein [Paludibacteraceae bacterium]